MIVSLEMTILQELLSQEYNFKWMHKCSKLQDKWEITIIATIIIALHH